MKLNPIKNNIIFRFIDKVDSKGQFVEETTWGLVIPGHFDSSAKKPRWAEVVAVGPDCKRVKVGRQVLVGALRWTTHFSIDNTKMWKTDENEIVAMRTDENAQLELFDGIVVFKRLDGRIKKRREIIAVGETEDNPTGQVLMTGPKCDKDILTPGTVFYFDGLNFFNEFKHGTEQLCYVKQDDVLMYEDLTA